MRKIMDLADACNGPANVMLDRKRCQLPLYLRVCESHRQSAELFVSSEKNLWRIYHHTPN